MDHDTPDKSLSPQVVDYVTSAARAALATIPFVGSLLAEIAGTVIPNQRIERIVRFAQALELRMSGLEQQYVLSQVSNEHFTDLVEEGLRQAARSVSQERREYIANVIGRSLNSKDVSYLESKHLLTLLGELNDIEIIRLASRLYDVVGSGEQYWEKHSEILAPIAAHLGSSPEELDKQTLQNSYDDHLKRLGLLEADGKLAPLGELVLKYAGVVAAE